MIKRFLKRFAKCIVCFLCMVGLLNVSNDPAKAVFIESSVAYGATQVIGSILVACGAYFTLSGDAQSVATSVFQDLKSNDKSTYDKIVNLVSPILSAGGLSGVSTVFRLSKELYDGIKASIERLFGTSDTQDPIYADGFDVTDFSNYPIRYSSITDDTLIPYFFSKGQYIKSIYLGRFTNLGVYSNVDKYCLMPDYENSKVNFSVCNLETGSVYVYRSFYVPEGKEQIDKICSLGFVFDDYFSTSSSSGNSLYIYLYIPAFDIQLSYSELPSLYFSNSTNRDTNVMRLILSSYQGTMTYPGEGLVIQSPDIPDSLPDDMTDLPPLVLNPQDIVGDIPEEKLQDIAFDTPLPADEVGADIGTGTLPDVDEGEGEGTIPKPENPPDTDTDTGGILDILKDFFDSPSEFKLNFDAFKNIILLDRFPFCIPFDFIDSVKAFSVPAQDLKFTIAFDTKFLDVNHTVDLSPYQVPIKFFRATASLWFAVVLILKTRDLIKW